MTDGTEQSAIKLLKRAIEYESSSQFQQSLVCYQEGIDLLLGVVRSCNEASKKAHYRKKIDEYMTRAELLKNTVNKLKETGKYHEQLHILDNSSGHSYISIFRSFLDDIVETVTIEDAYIRSFHQINNFLRFCEMIVTYCTNVKCIELKTSPDPQNFDQQNQNLKLIGSSLLKRNIQLVLQYTTELHDREIRLDNGWIIKIGRGLDFFKRVDKFEIGFHDMNLRPCHATTVDIFHSAYTKQNTNS